MKSIILERVKGQPGIGNEWLISNFSYMANETELTCPLISVDVFFISRICLCVIDIEFSLKKFQYLGKLVLFTSIQINGVININSRSTMSKLRQSKF